MGVCMVVCGVHMVWCDAVCEEVWGDVGRYEGGGVYGKHEGGG